MSAEVLLIAFAFIVVAIELLNLSSGTKLKAAFTFSFFGFAAAGVAAILQNDTAELFANALVIDPVSQFFKALLCFSCVLIVLMARISKEIREHERNEFYILLMLTILGMCIFCSAAHMLVLFLSFVMASLGCNILVVFYRRNPASSEAGVKLFVHTSLTVLLLSIGIAMLYAIAGSFQISVIKEHIAKLSIANDTLFYLWSAFALVLIAVASLTAIFPFHAVFPDVIQGAATPVSAFLTVGPPVIGVAFLFRLCLQIFSVKTDTGWAEHTGFHWQSLMAGLAVATMTLGNLLALRQKNIKRMLSYACIAQMGYLLLGISVATKIGVAAILYFLASNVLVVLGCFLIVQMATDQNQNGDITSLKGLAWKNPFLAVAFSVFVLSLAGMPPLPGFVGRFYVLGAAVEQKQFWLVFFVLFNWVVGLSYFLQLLHQVIKSESSVDAERSTQGILNEAVSLVRVCLAVIFVPAIFVGISWEPFLNFISRSLDSAKW